MCGFFAIRASSLPELTMDRELITVPLHLRYPIEQRSPSTIYSSKKIHQFFMCMTNRHKFNKKKRFQIEKYIACWEIFWQRNNMYDHTLLVLIILKELWVTCPNLNKCSPQTARGDQRIQAVLRFINVFVCNGIVARSDRAYLSSEHFVQLTRDYLYDDFCVADKSLEDSLQKMEQFILFLRTSMMPAANIFDTDEWGDVPSAEVQMAVARSFLLLHNSSEGWEVEE